MDTPQEKQWIDLTPEERKFQCFLQLDIGFWEGLAAHHQKLANDSRLTPQGRINNTSVFVFCTVRLIQLHSDNPYSLEDDLQRG